MDAPPFETTAGFLARFVRPLLGGGVVEVHAPLSAADRDRMLADASALLDPELLHLRTRAAQRLVADPLLPDPGADELSLWLGLHDVLALDHPDTERVWTRDRTWRKVENETRALLAFAHPSGIAEALARHIAVGAFLALCREDHIVSGPEGEHRFIGQEPPRRRFALFGPDLRDVRRERVAWIDQTHRPPAQRLLPDIMWVSPLTSLLRPGWSPPGWSPLMAAGFLRSRGYARAVCHTWAREREWLRIGGVVAGSLLRSLSLVDEIFGSRKDPAIPGTAAAMQQAAGLVDLGEDELDLLDDTDEGGGASAGFGSVRASSAAIAALPAPALEIDPLDVGAVLGALIHLHLLKVLEFDARIGIGFGARDWAVQTFLALPLLVTALEPVLGWPLDVEGPDRALGRRWEEYREHLAGLVPRPVVDNLLATLVRRVVERQPA
ncbi:hypothetical protein G6O69_29420 [Pseudenhygromyxa sp. WMMC2535]|uniref:hypothetical protein n=1 Tax=Pseudenhygromyxa sp. WMMC2535 TaxID=2712867 RepID=UPI00155406FA|nr:hypothetical protein [Pseudenhygromyxa sp. WMMC2535]NVB41983.1 hypothetical protein [Pseudenhygromyxa sp. WMMC2535]